MVTARTHRKKLSKAQQKMLPFYWLKREETQRINRNKWIKLSTHKTGQAQSKLKERYMKNYKKKQNLTSSQTEKNIEK